MTDADRRFRVPFDPRHFEKLAQRGAAYCAADVFRIIHEQNLWAGGESVSGAGSARDQTRIVRSELPGLLRRHHVETLVDTPCGDFGWLGTVELPIRRYIGADIVPELVRRNERLHGSPTRRFVELDLIVGPVPAGDLVLCRDCLVHLSFADSAAAITNIRRSGARLLLTTTFPACERNDDIATGDWRPINLQLPPFDFPPPIELLNEGCTEGGGAFADKSLGLWAL